MTTDSPVDVAEKTLASGQASGANNPSHHPLGSPSLVTSCSPQAPCTRRQGQRHAKHYRVREGALRRFVGIFPSPHKHFIGPWADSGRGPGRTPRDLLTPVRPTDMARWRGLRAHLPAKAPTAPEGYHLPHQPPWLSSTGHRPAFRGVGGRVSCCTLALTQNDHGQSCGRGRKDIGKWSGIRRKQPIPPSPWLP